MIIDRELPDAATETLLVLDATTGQNGLMQAKRSFKRDGGADGHRPDQARRNGQGRHRHRHRAASCRSPVKFVGVGEGADDLRPFDAREFLQELF